MSYSKQEHRGVPEGSKSCLHHLRPEKQLWERGRRQQFAGGGGQQLGIGRTAYTGRALGTTGVRVTNGKTYLLCMYNINN